MRTKKKRITAMFMSVLLAASTAAGAVPVTVHAEGDVTVNMANIGVPLLNAANRDNSQVKDEFLYKNSDEAILNPGYKFNNIIENRNLASAAPSNLAAGFSTKFTKKNNDSWWVVSYGWPFGRDSSAEVFRQLINKGDITYEMSGKLSYDNHTNFSNHWKRKNDCATLTMYQNAQLQKRYKSSTTGPEKTLSTVYGRGTWLKPMSGATTFQVTMYHDTCSCGSSAATNVAVAFADTVPAKITSVTTSSGQSYFSDGYVDIVITFDENIRFTDGGTSQKTANSTNQLVLDAYNRRTKQSVSGVTAQLVSLDGNKLTYRYTVPNNETTDIVIRGVASASAQTMFSSSNAQALYLYTSRGRYENIYGSNTAYRNIATVRSPFTDLAGNSLADGWKATQFNGNSEIYIDTVPPQYSETDITGSMMTEEPIGPNETWPDDIDRSQVFAGVGDTITFSSTFDEEIRVDPSQVTAVLNIKNGSGSNVTVRGSKTEAISTGVNSNIKVTKITFEPLTITSDMVPENDGSAIRIKTVEMPSGAADLCGNEFAASSLTITNAPRQQEWLDTVAPRVTNGGVVAEESYYSGGTEPVQGFCVQIQILDQMYDTSIISSGNASKYISGANAVGDGDQARESGIAILNNADGVSGAIYEYCITSTADVPSEGSWQTAHLGEELAFTQLETGNYIHVRLAEGSETGITNPVLTIKGYDHAGNFASEDISVNIRLYEKVLPATDSDLSISTDTSSSASGSVTVTDKGGLDEVKYAVQIAASNSETVEEPETPTVDEARAATDWQTQTGEGEEKLDISVSSVPLETGKNNFVFVHVYASDRSGNETVNTHKFNFNLMLPSFEINVPKGISDGVVSISKLNKDDAKRLGWTLERIQNVNFEESAANQQGNSSYIQSYGSLYVIARETRTNRTVGMFVDDLTDANNNFSSDPNSFQPVSKEPFENLEITDLLSQLYAVEEDPAAADPYSDEPAAINYKTNTAYLQGGMTWDGWGIDFNTGEVIQGAGGIGDFAINNYGMDSADHSSEPDYVWSGAPDYLSTYRNKVNGFAGTLANYYGNVDIYTMVIDGKWLSQQTHQTESERYVSWVRLRYLDQFTRDQAELGGNDAKPVMVQKYTVKSARNDGKSDPINTASVTSIRDASGKTISSDDQRLNTDADFDGTAATRFKTLENMQLAFTVRNNRIADWGIEDIDFEDSYVSIYRDGQSDPVYTKPLEADSASQLLVFPDDIEYTTGNYRVSVTLKAKVSGRVDTIDFGQRFCVDSTEADVNGGIRRIYINLQDFGYYEVSDDNEDTAVFESIVVAENGEYQYIDYLSDTIGYGDKTKLKMWISGKEENAVYYDGYDMQLVNLNNSAAEITDTYINVPTGEPTVICYQEVLCNGEMTPVRQLTLNVSNDVPQLELEVVPDGISRSVQLKVNSLHSMNGEIYNVIKTDEFGSWYETTVTEDGLLSISGSDTFTSPGTMTFITIDEYGIYSLCDIQLDEHLDRDPPLIDTNLLSGASDSYKVELNLSEVKPVFDEDMNSEDRCVLYISPEQPDMTPSPTDEPTYPSGPPTTSGPPSSGYSLSLDAALYDADEAEAVPQPQTVPQDETGEESGDYGEADADMFAIELSEANEVTFGDSPNAAGIFSMTANPESGMPSYWEDENGVSYLSVIIEGKVPSSGALYAYAVDAAGNVSEIKNLLEGSGASYSAPEITGIERADDGSLALTFSSGVIVTEPRSAKADITYTTEKIGIPIYSDGKYDITFEDIFGEEHTQQIEVALDGHLGLNVSMTPLERTNQNVILDISSARGDEMMTITDCTLADGTDITHTIADDGQSAQITATDNCSIKVSLLYGGQTYERIFTVDNIDRNVEAGVSWEYEADVTDGVTAGEVTAIVYPLDNEDDLVGTNGALTYTFTSGKAGEDKYEFQFTDQAGNVGSIEAVLPVDIDIPVPVSLSYTMDIYGSRSSLTMPIGSYTYNTDDLYEFEQLPASQKDVISISTNLDTRMVILSAGTAADQITSDTQSETIEGVTLNGKTVTVTDNAEFVIGLIADEDVPNYDPEAPRVIAIPVNIENIRILGSVSIIYANVDNYTRRAYLEMNGQELTVTNSEGVEIDNEHVQYNGYYYHDFETNGTFVFYYRDEVGNTGSITAMVSDILDADIQPLSIEKPIRWWPYKDATGADQSELSEDPVNYNVTAQVRFNMNVSEAALYYENDDGNRGELVGTDRALVNASFDTVDITYGNNISDTILWVLGENGSEYEVHIGEITIIDKTLPEITNNYTPGEPRRSVDIVFTPNEEVLCVQVPSEEKYSQDNPMTVTVEENGTFIYTFTVNAGNVQQVSVTVTDIDNDAPVLTFRLTPDGQSYDSWESLSSQNDVTNIESVFISSNENGRYTFQETEGSLNANEWTRLQIERNGVYPLNVWDTAGNMTFTGLYGILIPDNTAPALWLSPQRISVDEGISKEELQERLGQGVLVSDNISESDKITVTWDTSSLNADAAGEYQVVYTAADEAGNKVSVARTVRVVGSDEITLSVNGSETTYMGTQILDTGVLSFSVGNLTNLNGVYEPYTLYVKKGFKTAGQMKNGATRVSNDSITVTGSGFYTVYVMTQNRKQYITYLYIEQ